MSNYIKKPEPGRFIREKVVERIIEKPVENKSESMDINALANAVAHAISLNLPQQQIQQPTQIVQVDGKSVDTFDNTNTMNRLADQMLVQRGDSKANFDDLGSVKKTKKDQKAVDDTIDLLKKLNN